MPNPDFTGTVPRMRCETCKHWDRWVSQRWGLCTASGTVLQSQDTGEIMTMVSNVTTTDLTVCSDWTAKDTQ